MHGVNTTINSRKK